MERFRFENQGTNTYLVCSLTNQNIDTMSLGMLTNNKIPGFAPALYMQQDEEKLMKYNISSQITLRQYFSGAVSKSRLLGVFSGIVTALNSAEEYMLDLNSVLLSMDYIFADVTGGGVKMICVPVLDMPERGYDYGTFFKQIMFSTQFDQSEDCGYVTRIINYLNGTSAFSAGEFGRLLHDLENMTRQLTENREAPPADRAYVETMLLREEENIKQRETEKTPETELLSGSGTASYETAPQKNPHSEEPAVLDGRMPGQEQEEKDISLFYLMRHYNKKNASQYKTQKAAKKQAEKEEKEQKKLEKKQQKQNKKEKAKKNASRQGMMAVPVNQNVQPGGMAVPGQGVQPEETKASPNRPVQQHLAVMPQIPEQIYDTVSSGRTNENFGETTVLVSRTAGETTVLKSANQTGPARPYLLRVRNGEKIYLDRPVLRIGKERSFVDYFISDNTAVSRSHANFIQKDKDCYVVDTNSTNHTYVNNRMIPSNVETVLHDGDKICLANEEFRYKQM